MLQNALAGFEAEVQTIKLRITLLQLVDHPQALQIVFKAAIVSHAGIERILARVAERRMPQVMGERDCFNQIFVEPEVAGDRTPQLSHLKRMRHPGAKKIPLVIQENLGFIDQTAKSAAVDDAIAVPLEGCAGRRGRLLKVTSPRPARVTGINSKQRQSQGFRGAALVS